MFYHKDYPKHTHVTHQTNMVLCAYLLILICHDSISPVPTPEPIPQYISVPLTSDTCVLHGQSMGYPLGCRWQKAHGGCCHCPACGCPFKDCGLGNGFIQVRLKALDSFLVQFICNYGHMDWVIDAYHVLCRFQILHTLVDHASMLFTVRS